MKISGTVKLKDFIMNKDKLEIKDWKNGIIALLLLLIVVIKVGYLIVPTLFGPPEMVNVKAVRSEQKEQAEALMERAYDKAEEFVEKNHSESIVAMEFVSPPEEYVTWIGGNQFTCVVNVDQTLKCDNTYIAQERTYIVIVEYLGDNKWKRLRTDNYCRRFLTGK